MHALISAKPAPPAPAGDTIRDIQLAEALGYERPTDIRKLIRRNMPMLEAMGTLRHYGVMIEAGNGARREVTEYHLNRAQTAFLIAKSNTRHAESLTLRMSEVFALFSEGRLVAADTAAEVELNAIQERDAERRRLIHAEERAARDAAFGILKRR